MPTIFACLIAILGLVLQFAIVALAVCERRRRRRAETRAVLCILQAGSGYLVLLVLSQRR